MKHQPDLAVGLSHHALYDLCRLWMIETGETLRHFRLSEWGTPERSNGFTEDPAGRLEILS
ncbi:hypothetical protein [Deinococcus humi]|uniref:Uncharacterized protein n=1 Tax=Deinococcus humi TaxID=662880 RepID=A0A7W8JXP0_9DEIO|nr:hypothetical protein [Deinococcus humi]MBB5363873.1 hypothetical protein [Deinococcus humi]